MKRVRYPMTNNTDVGAFRYEYEYLNDVGTAMSRVGRILDFNNLRLVEYSWLGNDTLTGEIRHPQVAGGLSDNMGTKTSKCNNFDRYWRVKTNQWQKTNGSVQFEVRNYRYDRSGNRLSADSQGSDNGVGNGTTTGKAADWDETYGYDGLNRLVAFNRGTYSGGSIASPKFSQTWTLDALGNWRGHTQTNNDTTLLPGVATFSQTRTANAANEITGITGGGYAATSYDAAGNMTAGAKTGAVGTQLKLVYDGWNRQAGYDANGDGDLLDAGDYRYFFDGLGRRVTKFADTANDGSNNAGLTEEYFYNERWQNLEVRTGTVTGGVKTVSSNPKERDIWDVSYVDAPAILEYDTDGNGSRDQQLWPTFDANYNVTGLLSGQGVTVERYAYTSYGERVVINGDQNYANSGADADGSEWTVDTNGSDYGNVVGWQGLRNDGEKGSWQQRGREDSAALGFEQRDPTLHRYQDGMNLYTVERSNPLMYRDPSGNQGIPGLDGPVPQGLLPDPKSPPPQPAPPQPSPIQQLIDKIKAILDELANNPPILNPRNAPPASFGTVKGTKAAEDALKDYYKDHPCDEASRRALELLQGVGRTTQPKIEKPGEK